VPVGLLVGCCVYVGFALRLWFLQLLQLDYMVGLLVAPGLHTHLWFCPLPHLPVTHLDSCWITLAGFGLIWDCWFGLLYLVGRCTDLDYGYICCPLRLGWLRLHIPHSYTLWFPTLPPHHTHTLLVYPQLPQLGSHTPHTHTFVHTLPHTQPCTHFSSWIPTFAVGFLWVLGCWLHTFIYRWVCIHVAVYTHGSHIHTHIHILVIHHTCLPSLYRFLPSFVDYLQLVALWITPHIHPLCPSSLGYPGSPLPVVYGCTWLGSHTPHPRLHYTRLPGLRTFTLPVTHVYGWLRSGWFGYIWLVHTHTHTHTHLLHGLPLVTHTFALVPSSSSCRFYLAFWFITVAPSHTGWLQLFPVPTPLFAVPDLADSLPHTCHTHLGFLLHRLYIATVPTFAHTLPSYPLRLVIPWVICLYPTQLQVRVYTHTWFTWLDSGFPTHTFALHPLCTHTHTAVPRATHTHTHTHPHTLPTQLHLAVTLPCRLLPFLYTVVHAPLYRTTRGYTHIHTRLVRVGWLVTPLLLPHLVLCTLRLVLGFIWLVAHGSPFTFPLDCPHTRIAPLLHTPLFYTPFSWIYG